MSETGAPPGEDEEPRTDRTDRGGLADANDGDADAAVASRSQEKAKRLTRNLNELLQELRVTQTGVQILTGFLLTLPFTTRFPDLDQVQKMAYLGVLVGSVLATGLIIAPVAFHRVLFRQGEREWIVNAANRSARSGLVALALTTSGVVWLVFDLVTNRAAAHTAGALSAVFFAGLWGVLPVLSRRVDED
jgi:hypothetical protein